MKKREWTDEEKRVLREHYPTLGLSGLIEAGLLPGRTRNAIRVKAAELEIVTPRPSVSRKPPEEPAWGRPYIADDEAAAWRLLRRCGWLDGSPSLGLRP